MTNRSTMLSMIVVIALLSANAFSFGQEVTAEWRSQKSENQMLLARFQINDSANEDPNVQEGEFPFKDPSTQYIFGDCQFSPDGKLLMMLVFDSKKSEGMGQVHVWDLNLNRQLLQVEFEFTMETYFLGGSSHTWFTPTFLQNKYLACSSNEAVQVWSLETGKRVASLNHRSVDQVITADDGKTLLTLSNKNTQPYHPGYEVKLWRVEDWTKPVSEFDDESLFGVVLADNGKVLIGCKQSPRRLIAWKTDSGEEIWSRSLKSSERSWHLSANQERLVVIDAANEDGGMVYRHAEFADIQTGRSSGQVLPPDGARFVGSVRGFFIGRSYPSSFANNFGTDDYFLYFLNGPFVPVFRKDNSLLVWNLAERDMPIELDMEQIGLEIGNGLENDKIYAFSLTENIYEFQFTQADSPAPGMPHTSNKSVLVDLKTGRKLDLSPNWSPLLGRVGAIHKQQLAHSLGSSPDRVVVTSLLSGKELLSLSHTNTNANTNRAPIYYDSRGEKIVTRSKSEIKIWDVASLQEADKK